MEGAPLGDILFLVITGFTHVKARVICIEILAVQFILDNAQFFAKSLVVHDFSGPQKTALNCGNFNFDCQ